MVLERSAVTGLPGLGVGKHRGPEQGACLMEYVSVLAGQRFTDRPACTPGAVAVVARRVNDAVSDRARPRLALWAPELIGAGRRDSGLDDVVVSCCTATGLAVTPHERHLSALQRRARRRLRHPWSRWLRVPAHAAVHEAFIATMAALGPLPADERDERLIALLAEVVRATRDATTGHGNDVRTDGPPRATSAAAPGAVEDARGTER
ncbi:hypothetical protein GCM10023200_26900 [Actinomycetospora chlora]|uniref:Uncharacterized protein n=1 Tax=Actinomycetospora chlora TaxID=663608 RepID=A0ABP9B5K5_9PSEU